MRVINHAFLPLSDPLLSFPRPVYGSTKFRGCSIAGLTAMIQVFGGELLKA